MHRSTPFQFVSILVIYLAWHVKLGWGQSIETYNEFLAMTMSDMYPCSECHFVTGSECCRFTLRDFPTVLLFEQQCPPSLAWNDRLCNCDWPENVQKCDPLKDCTTQIAQTPPPCPALNLAKQCCLENIGQWYTKVNDTSFRFQNDTIAQICPLDQIFDIEDCCCVDRAPKVATGTSCKHWPFDITTNITDQLQNTLATDFPDEVHMVEGKFGEGLMLQPNERISIAEFTGKTLGHKGRQFSIGFWVYTQDADTSPTIIISNGDADVNPTLAFLSFGNTISGGVGTAGETRDTPTADYIFRVLRNDGWHYVALAYSDPFTRLYVDDVRPKFSESGGNIMANRCQLNIGGNNRHPLVIDELVMCDFAWTSRQIVELREANTIPFREDWQ
ncbi:unnamed protein product [Owenia fusiformis]|uniref:Chitin-binding type-2 domain-containing protein n=1 Tax=Owenia fusiformis TaxID=6347 RepID=A0A8S4N258_OWEFU|nr:unnamed protein product [Owenia fusiformis]